MSNYMAQIAIMCYVCHKIVMYAQGWTYVDISS